MEKEVQLKKKVTLKRKGDTAGISDFTKMIVTLNWTLQEDDSGELGPDFDLMAFYKTKDGKKGGVCAEGYNANKDDMGFLDKFPYMQLDQDAAADDNSKAGDEESEEMKIGKLDDFDKVYICVINYDDAIDNKPAVFGSYKGYVSVTTDTGDNFEVPMDEKEKQGHVALICSINNTSGNPKLVNENKILTLGEFADSIPGAELVVNL